MSDNEEILKATPSESLLVYPRSGLIRLYCPIKAECIIEIPPILVDQIVYIEGISYTNQKPLLYLIRSRLYPHNYFKIINQEPIP